MDGGDQSPDAPARRHRESPVRADFLLSPVFLASLAVILVNDLVLKPYHPGIVSGIASDIAGMVFFPVLLVALVEVIAFVLPAKPWATPRWFLASAGFIALVFVLAKFTVAGEEVFELVVGPVERITGPVLLLPQTGLVADPWDLLALPFGLVAWWIGVRWRSPARGLEAPRRG